MRAVLIVGIVLVGLVNTPLLHAQVSSRAKSGVGGYFDLAFETMSVRGDRGLVTGLGFGMIFGSRLSVGLAGYGLWSSTIRTTTLAIANANARFHIVWGGIEGSFVILRADPFRMTAEAFAGVGNVQLPTGAFNQLVKDLEERRGAAGSLPEDKDQFYLLRPSLLAQWYPYAWLGVSLFCTYRIAAGVSYFTMSNGDLSGFDFGVRVAVGSF